MSGFDINRLGSVTGVRPLSQEPSGAKQQQQSSKADTAVQAGVSVETSFRAEAGDAPVDSDRVAEIRAALRDGTYPITPARIADAMIAARLQLIGDK